MTTSKKKSATKASKTRIPSQTPSTNRNRFDTFADDDDGPKPSYSKVAASNRITDMPPSDTKIQPSDNSDNPETQDSTLVKLLSAFQSVTDRLEINETTMKNQFVSTNNRFSNIENTLGFNQISLDEKILS